MIEKIKEVLVTKLSPATSRYPSIVIADSLFGLTKEVWDDEKDMWRLKEFEELLKFSRLVFLH